MTLLKSTGFAALMIGAMMLHSYASWQEAVGF